jgi:hypothetical protein
MTETALKADPQAGSVCISLALGTPWNYHFEPARPPPASSTRTPPTSCPSDPGRSLGPWPIGRDTASPTALHSQTSWCIVSIQARAGGQSFLLQANAGNQADSRALRHFPTEQSAARRQLATSTGVGSKPAMPSLESLHPTRRPAPQGGVRGGRYAGTGEAADLNKLGYCDTRKQDYSHRTFTAYCPNKNTSTGKQVCRQHP